MSETTYYQRNREAILNRAKDYYRGRIQGATTAANAVPRNCSH